MDSVYEKVGALLKDTSNIEQEKAYKEKRLLDCNASIELLNKRKDVILASKEYYKKAIDILYESSVKELENLINDVLEVIFFDRSFSIKLELSDSRSKSLIWYLHDENTGMDLSIDDGVGRGIRTVLSFVIQSYYCLSLDSKYLFIDEGYHYISEAYVGKFFEFVQTLCSERNLSLIMISHDDRFLPYVDKNYRVTEGEIGEIK